VDVDIRKLQTKADVPATSEVIQTYLSDWKSV
jgi:hypothetical protein